MSDNRLLLRSAAHSADHVKKAKKIFSVAIVMLPVFSSFRLATKMFAQSPDEAILGPPPSMFVTVKYFKLEGYIVNIEIEYIFY